jgi:hypothetical protein
MVASPSVDVAEAWTLPVAQTVYGTGTGGLMRFPFIHSLVSGSFSQPEIPIFLNGVVANPMNLSVGLSSVFGL